MTPQRKLTALVALAALLMGNVVAFVHVGQHQSGVGSSGTVAANEASTASSCSCCSHGNKCEPTDAGSSQPAQQEHDSGSCSICQSFYTSRAGVQPPAPVLVDCGNAVGFLPSRNSPVAVASAPSGFEARGPPSLA